MYTIVVGVDESEGSRKALEWATEQASARGGKLILVHAYQVLAGYQPDPETSESGGTGETPVEQETRKAAETFLKGLVTELPDDVEIETVVRKGRSSEVLLEHAEGADMIEVTRRLTRFTAPWSMANLPSLSVPCGFDSLGLPLGIQLAGRRWTDGLVLRAGVAYQEATEWHLARPEADVPGSGHTG